MYRRIELIDECGIVEGVFDAYKGGIMMSGADPVIESWVHDLRGPFRSIPRNSRFWFTESGWAVVGRRVVTALGRAGQRYRVVAVKENAINVVWRDRFTGYEVAAQPVVARSGRGRKRCRDAHSEE